MGQLAEHYWLASQAHEITAEPTAEVGCIGTMAVLHDLSQMAAQDGIKVHVVTSKGATHKGVGVPGTEITEEQLQDVQERVDAVNDFFVSSIARGRGIAKRDAQSLADGRVHIAATAKSLGLVDRVMSSDEALRRLQRQSRSQRQARSNLHDM